MRPDSRLLPTRRALPAASLLALLAGFACSSVDRTPATGSDPAPGPMAPPEASEAEGVPESDPSPSSSGGLTEDEILAIPPEVGSETDLLDIGAKSLEELNTEGHLKDVQFDYDSADLSPPMRATLEENAAWLSRYPSVRILVEGHCDERGTVEYNQALGERRARAAYDYLVSLGVPDSRLEMISYGKERPQCTESDESCWQRNRRAHFKITAK